MDASRRSLLKGAACAGLAVTGISAAAEAAGPVLPPKDAAAMLYDATRCIGCKACVVACREANGLPPVAADGIHDEPMRLSSATKNIIKLYRGEGAISYMKSQCMHCVDPACCGACMLGALQKRERGIVWWDADKCVGCRYCQMACPFNIPKFEWESRNPRIVKCEFCRHLLAEGGTPACCRVCPSQAVVYGTREDLLAEAHSRLAAEPGRYVPRVYGEHDGGGTQVLYLSAVPFEKLGLPDLGSEAQAAVARSVQHTALRFLAAPVAVIAVLAAALRKVVPKEEAK